jgi:long-chain acyl-CoA synthetase
VGKAIAGLDVKIAADGEILVRGENVTSGYYNAPAETAAAFEDGWLHTGDIGEMDAEGRLFVRGRKKEMIVTPEGLNVFPEDVERVIDQVAGVRESAVVGLTQGGEERVHAVLVVDAGTTPDDVVRQANARLADHQRIRGASVWPGSELPRTAGTRKLKRREVKQWAESGRPPVADTRGGSLEQVLSRFTRGRELAPGTTIEELGLSSLERVELMVALEDAFQTTVDEGAFSRAKDISELKGLLDTTTPRAAEPPEGVPLPGWSRSWPVRVVRRLSLPTWILPWARLFAWLHVEGRRHLDALTGPAIFAANHQSHMDTPVIFLALPARHRYRVAPAMAKEFFHAHFHPSQHSRRERVTNSLNYYLAAAFFNAFPLPQREAGARQTLRHIGDLLGEGYSILIFPEGERSESGAIGTFRPGVGMIAARLGVPVVPVRLDGVQNVLRSGWRLARIARVRVAFGAPLHFKGDAYADYAKQVESAVRNL